MPGLNNRFLLLYASQTGQAKAIAEEIAERAEKHSLFADVHCIGDTEKRFFIEREKCAVIVASTTGDGDPPDTARKFFRRIHKKTLADDYFADLNFTVLGLGDSNYSSFCNHSKNLNRRLLALGAKHFYEPGWADDAVGLEVVVDPWIDELWPALRKHLGLSGVDSVISDYEPVTTSSDKSQTTDHTQQPNLQSTQQTDLQSTDNTQQPNLQTTDNIKQLSNSVETDLILSRDKVNSPTTSINNQTSLGDSGETSDIRTKVVDESGRNTTVEGAKNQNIESDCQPIAKPQNMSTGNKSGGVSNSAATLTTAVDVRDGGDSPLNGGQKDIASVRVSVPPLSESTLTVPLLPPAFLKIQFHSGSIDDLNQELAGTVTTSSSTPVTMATVSAARVLTSDTAIKKTMAVTLDITGCEFKFEPGDSFHLVCPNPKEEVLLLLNRLGCVDTVTNPYSLSVLEGTKKKNPSVPSHVPASGTLLHLFTTCLDIREPPKKALLRMLVEHTDNESERRRMQELCSKQGASDYTKYVREPSLSLLDVLNQFPSCQPPVERLVELMSRLKPRPYSICSSPLRSSNKFEFVFNVIEIPAESGRTYHRKGVCTGWLETLVPAGSRAANNTGVTDGHNSEVESTRETQRQGNDTCNSEILSDEMGNMSLTDVVKVSISPQMNQSFHLPDDVTIPLILIGPGTGVSPFLGFLEHRAAQRASQSTEKFGEIWLFYGCRHKDRDYLYRQELSEHVESGVLSRLLVCFSRDDQPLGDPRYVQDNLRAHGAEIIDLVDNKRANTYVCGDAKNMAKDVNEAFMDIWVKHKDMTADEAKRMMMKLRLERRYREDVWT